ncbi:hypothetical protein DW088_12665 [Butyricicoccus sp. AM05-1]|uniref:hypothetical protein n=1 Tax=Butyricicoccus sp. AM05-1 TaxID=2292004 RepID=UPI000E49C026|nr:hypothetical protein [Butyricicoccus sp. AM05-1]RHO61877.1 hypothetical protein DW088_12665 [Butyricicoccus sp. AM05-1]
MKKLIIACSAVLVLGLGLTAAGHLLGGQLYSVYYHGALHPFSETARHFSDKLEDVSDSYVSPDDEIDSDFDTGWVQDYLETRRNAIEHGDMPIQSVDQIDYIDLTLNGGEFTIENGSDFAVSASANFADTQISGTHWAASLWANDEPATITLPRDGNYLQIRISCGQQANVTIRDRLSAQNIELSAGNGTLIADKLYGYRITLDATDGRLSATLPESADQYHIQATTNWGTVIMNGTPLVQMDELGNGTAQYDNRAEHVPHDLQARVSGSGQISLLSQVTLANADAPV